ncbi:MAG: TRAM domain-containing protein, partial [Candidatus Portnoybacteria bacterium]|nr:TRAM domain-containing protein [Candidatus Portnoybacteria bacterium]
FKKDNNYIGKATHYKTVKIKIKSKNKVGKFINVKITKAEPWGLKGIEK